MTQIRENYYCKLCNNLVEIVCSGAGALYCCGEEMTLLEPNTTDAANEKHVPEIIDNGDSIQVNIGSVEHPMTEEHHIAYIECRTAKKVIRKELKPGDKPTAKFPIKMEKVLEVREFCNLHMLWKK